MESIRTATDSASIVLSIDLVFLVHLFQFHRNLLRFDSISTVRLIILFLSPSYLAGYQLPANCCRLLSRYWTLFFPIFVNISAIYPPIRRERERGREGGRERKFPCLLLRLLSFNYSAIIIPFVCFHHFHESSFRKCGSGLKQVSIRDWKRRRKSSESSHQRRHVDFK